MSRDRTGQDRKAPPRPPLSLHCHAPHLICHCQSIRSTAFRRDWAHSHRSCPTTSHSHRWAPLLFHQLFPISSFLSLRWLLLRLTPSLHSSLPRVSIRGACYAIRERRASGLDGLQGKGCGTRSDEPEDRNSSVVGGWMGGGWGSKIPIKKIPNAKSLCCCSLSIARLKREIGGVWSE